ncbi:hypothetical protein MMC20_003307 [Loxospora ochrophaea]|nr:hypothetical protein [Loxospora ochrophaea]
MNSPVPSAADHSPPTAQQEQALPETSRTGCESQDNPHQNRGARLLSEPYTRGIGRHTLGLLLILITVFLWTASNFLASTIFADASYSKPYLVTYVNTSFFSIFLCYVAVRRAWASGGNLRKALQSKRGSTHYAPIVDHDDEPPRKSNGPQDLPQSSSSTSLMDEPTAGLENEDTERVASPEDALDNWETAKLGLEFCLLWFAANYFAAACLSYTTVASSTILTSTSSIWTLLFGALFGGEKYTLRKLLGVLASMAGITLISSVDLFGDNDELRGSFPHKTKGEIAIGDILAVASAILYGIYIIFMKKRIGNEERVSMPLFFSYVGIFNMLFLWPGFFLLHFTKIETFQLPQTRRILAIVLANAAISFVSEFCWAYAMLLTSPLIVTVGISLTIPVSLIGQMIINGQYSSLAYWAGALIVFLSFVFINGESTSRTLNQDDQLADGVVSRTHED